MKKITDITAALNIFEEAAISHLEATKLGDYKKGNKCYNNIVRAVQFLRDESATDSLFNLLSNPSIGVRLWAATYLLPTHNKESVYTLEEIVHTPGIQSLIAETTLNEWKKGGLKLW